MTLDELKAECDEAEQAGLESTALVLPHGVSLRGFPRGELLCETAGHGRVYRFKIAALRRFAERAAKGAT